MFGPHGIRVQNLKRDGLPDIAVDRLMNLLCNDQINLTHSGPVLFKRKDTGGLVAVNGGGYRGDSYGDHSVPHTFYVRSGYNGSEFIVNGTENADLSTGPGLDEEGRGYVNHGQIIFRNGDVIFESDRPEGIDEFLVALRSIFSGNVHFSNQVTFGGIVELGDATVNGLGSSSNPITAYAYYTGGSQSIPQNVTTPLTISSTAIQSNVSYDSGTKIITFASSGLHIIGLTAILSYSVASGAQVSVTYGLEASPYTGLSSYVGHAAIPSLSSTSRSGAAGIAAVHVVNMTGGDQYKLSALVTGNITSMSVSPRITVARIGS